MLIGSVGWLVGLVWFGLVVVFVVVVCVCLFLFLIPQVICGIYRLWEQRSSSWAATYWRLIVSDIVGAVPDRHADFVKTLTQTRHHLNSKTRTNMT